MAELITDEIFSDGQANIAASNMNGIVGRSRVQPDIIANKVASSTMNVADQMLVLKTDNTLARARFDTIVNSTSSALPIADTTKNGMLRQVSGKTTDFVDGTNNCQSIHALLPAGVVVDYAGVTIPPLGWLYCDGRSLLMTDYPDLYAAIGTTYGSVDATHFNIPDARGKVTAGVGGSFGALAATGGVATVALAVGNLPSHTHTMGSHTHTGAYHEHSMQNHTHGMDHAHGMDHQHTIGAGQFNHSHTYNGTVTPGGANLAAGTAFSPASGQTTSAWAQPQGVTLYASQTNAAWGNTLYASQTNGVWANTGGASVGNTAGPDRGLTTTGPSTNTTDATGSGTAFSILPPYLVTQKIVKT
jgi:Phage Tail Collar Domain